MPVVNKLLLFGCFYKEKRRKKQEQWKNGNCSITPFNNKYSQAVLLTKEGPRVFIFAFFWCPSERQGDKKPLRQLAELPSCSFPWIAGPWCQPWAHLGDSRSKAQLLEVFILWVWDPTVHVTKNSTHPSQCSPGVPAHPPGSSWLNSPAQCGFCKEISG